MRMKALGSLWMLGVTCGLAVGSASWAIDHTRRGPAFKIGDPASAIEPLAWIKGNPVTKFERGRVYVFEFWATWCQPCNQAMPHLSALQKKYANTLTIIGVNVYEESGGGKADIDAISAFVRKKGNKMAYTVAMDDPCKKTVCDTWITASGSLGIPDAFIIDKQGKLAWVGRMPTVRSYTFDQALEDTLAVRRI